MTHPSDDEVLLNRYVDGEISPDERETIENRLAAEPELRSQLADLVSFSATLGIGLAGASVGEGAGPNRVETRTQPTAGIRRNPGLVAAAAVVCVAVVGTLGWWASHGGTSSPSSAQVLDPYAVLAGLGPTVDTPAMRADLGELLDSATKPQRRLDIYQSWRTPNAGLLEPLIWALAPRESDPTARASLFITIPRDTPIRDYPALISMARAEWDRKALEPLSQLITHLQAHRGPETEEFFAEVLRKRATLPARWIAERLPPIQVAFPTSPEICAETTAALNDPNETVRAAAGLARAAIHQRDGIECARRLLKSTSTDVRLVAATTIARHGWEADIPELVPLASDPDPSIQKIARTALSAHEIPLPSNP